jgi:membrane fusion protein (multidrug efflux system)
VLTTIVSQDPMYVAFPVSQREFLNVKRSELQANDRKIQATIRFSDGSFYDKPAVLDFLGVTVDRKTDTVLVRGTIPNHDGVLFDGQLIRVTVEGDRPEEKVLVPQTALLADQQGTYSLSSRTANPRSAASRSAVKRVPTQFLTAVLPAASR